MLALDSHNSSQKLLASFSKLASASSVSDQTVSWHGFNSRFIFFSSYFSKAMVYKIGWCNVATRLFSHRSTLSRWFIDVAFLFLLSQTFLIFQLILSFSRWKQTGQVQKKDYLRQSTMQIGMSKFIKLKVTQDLCGFTFSPRLNPLIFAIKLCSCPFLWPDL